MRKNAPALLTLALIFTLIPIFAWSGPKKKTDPIDCYALLVIAGDDTNVTVHKNLDPIDVNGAEVALTRVYASLTEAGYKDENMKILYCNGRLQPDWSEKKNAKYFKMIRKNHFKSSVGAASIDNIKQAVDNFKKKADSNDQFVFYIVTHGAADGTLMLPARRRLTCAQIQTIFTGFKSKTNYLLFDSCFSGKIIDRVDVANAVIVTATTSRTAGWVDRNFSNNAYFLECKNNPKLDKNKDGMVDCTEAYKEALKHAKKYDKKWRKYVKTKYRPPKPMPPGIMNMTSIIPKIEIGDDFEKHNLGSKGAGKSTKTSAGKKSSVKKKTKRDPGEKLMKRAAALEKSKKFAEAVEYYKKVEKMGARSKLSAEAAKKAKELLADEEIAKQYKKAVLNKKLDADLAMAQSYYLAGRNDLATKFCDKVIKAAPKSPQAKKARKLKKQADDWR